VTIYNRMTMVEEYVHDLQNVDHLEAVKGPGHRMIEDLAIEVKNKNLN
jgi:hypothetical protein